MAIYSGFTHWKWWFSSSLWQFARGYDEWIWTVCFKKTRRTIGDVRQPRYCCFPIKWSQKRIWYHRQTSEVWLPAISIILVSCIWWLLQVGMEIGYTNYSMWNHQPNVDCLQYMFISIRCHATSGCGYAYGMLIESTKNERERESVSQKTCIRLEYYIYIQCVYIYD